MPRRARGKDALRDSPASTMVAGQRKSGATRHHAAVNALRAHGGDASAHGASHELAGNFCDACIACEANRLAQGWRHNRSCQIRLRVRPSSSHGNGHVGADRRADASTAGRERSAGGKEPLREDATAGAATRMWGFVVQFCVGICPSSPSLFFNRTVLNKDAADILLRSLS